MSAKPADLHARACHAAGEEITGVVVAAGVADAARATGTNVTAVVNLPDGLCLAVLEARENRERTVPFAWHPELDDTGCELLQSFWDAGLFEGSLEAAIAICHGER